MKAKKTGPSTQIPLDEYRTYIYTYIYIYIIKTHILTSSSDDILSRRAAAHSVPFINRCRGVCGHCPGGAGIVGVINSSCGTIVYIYIYMCVYIYVCGYVDMWIYINFN